MKAVINPAVSGIRHRCVLVLDINSLANNAVNIGISVPQIRLMNCPIRGSVPRKWEAKATING